MKKLYLCWTLLGLLFAPFIWAQNSVTGTVNDETGLPLPGATVVVEGTSRGVATDFDGNFSIEAELGEVLVITYVGYAEQRITIGSQDNYTIGLSPDKNQKNQLGYLIPVFEKNIIKLLKRKKKNYLEETIPRISLERAFPPRFVDEIQYFLSLEERTPFYLGNDIKEVVKNLPSELKDKAKAKKIVLKRIKDEISLYSALNQLMVN